MAVVTLDPAATFSGALSNGNLTMTSSANNGIAYSTTTKSTGKWHLEVTLGSSTANTGHGFGISATNTGVIGTNGIGSDAAGTSLGIFTGARATAQAVGIQWKNATQGSLFTAGGVGANDTMAVEIDFDAQLLWLRASYQSLWNNSGTANPATGTGGVSFSALLTKGPVYYFGCDPWYSGFVQTINFGATAFAVTPSTGFSAWQGAATPATTHAAALMVGV